METLRTLGDVLYAGSQQPLVSEKNWVRLAQRGAAGERSALLGLYERAHRPVFTLMVRLTGNRESAEELTLDLFDDIWRGASRYRAADGTVLGWIMNMARSKALDWLRIERQRRARPAAVDDRLKSSPMEMLRPAAAVRERLAKCIAGAGDANAIQPERPAWSAPGWEEVAPGIACQLLATDTEKHRVSMLVRLAPGGEYPAHRHAGLEELHLLEGELWIDERKLHAGDYNRAEAGSSDLRVWSETGCACVLVTSTKDVLG